MTKDTKSFTLDQEVIKGIEQEAKDRDLSRSEIVNEILKRDITIDESHFKPGDEEGIERAINQTKIEIDSTKSRISSLKADKRSVEEKLRKSENRLDRLEEKLEELEELKSNES